MPQIYHKKKRFFFLEDSKSELNILFTCFFRTDTQTQHLFIRHFCASATDSEIVIQQKILRCGRFLCWLCSARHTESLNTLNATKI